MDTKHSHTSAVMAAPRLLAMLMLAIWTPTAQAITYADWIASYGLTGADASETADPDADGIPNLLEYALDTGSPIANGGLVSALPEYGYAARTGQGLYQWQWGAKTGGIGGIYHAAIRWRPRPGAEGIRYQPELSTDLDKWFSARSAFYNETAPGGVVQSTALMPNNRFKRYFMRLRVIVDPDIMDTLSGIRTGGIAAQALDVGAPIATKRATSAGSTAAIISQDRQLTESTGVDTITDYTWAWAPQPSNVDAVSITRSSTAPAVIMPDADNPYLWHAVAPGTATLKLQTGTSNYEEMVTVSTASGQTTDTLTGYVPGSLHQVLMATVDNAIAGTTPTASLRLFSVQDHTGGGYVRNPSAWPALAGYTQALTAISPWNSNGGVTKAGVAISPRHILFAAHYQIAVGSTIRFVAADNTVITRTLTARTTLAGWTSSNLYPDLTVGCLDSDLPASITPAAVLPDGFEAALPQLTGGQLIPALCLDQEEKALISDWSTHTTSSHLVEGFSAPANPDRADYYEDKISGDSGNPAGLLIDGQFVLLTCWTYGGGGGGTSVIGTKAEIQSIMDAQAPGYSLTTADLSGYPTY